MVVGPGPNGTHPGAAETWLEGLTVSPMDEATPPNLTKGARLPVKSGGQVQGGTLLRPIRWPQFQGNYLWRSIVGKFVMGTSAQHPKTVRDVSIRPIGDRPVPLHGACVMFSAWSAFLENLSFQNLGA